LGTAWVLLLGSTLLVEEIFSHFTHKFVAHREQGTGVDTHGV
jgi:hypothetical protein